MRLQSHISLETTRMEKRFTMKNILTIMVLFIFMALIPAVESSGGTPQVEYGSVLNQDGTPSPGDNIQFKSYIQGNFTDTQTHTSPGCGYENGYWFLEMGNFSEAWTADQTLKVLFRNQASGTLKYMEVTLGNQGTQHDVRFQSQQMDTDLDGLPDDWERYFDLNPALDDASVDTDGDRYTNLEEYLADTNPRNIDSYPELIGLCGDVNENDRVDIGDAMFIAQYLVGNRQSSGLNLNLGNVNVNDRIDIGDPMFIAQYLVGNRACLCKGIRMEVCAD